MSSKLNKRELSKSICGYIIWRKAHCVPCQAISSSTVPNKSSTSGDFGRRLGALTYHHLADGDDQMRCYAYDLYMNYHPIDQFS